MPSGPAKADASRGLLCPTPVMRGTRRAEAELLSLSLRTPLSSRAPHTMDGNSRRRRNSTSDALFYLRNPSAAATARSDLFNVLGQMR